MVLFWDMFDVISCSHKNTMNRHFPLLGATKFSSLYPEHDAKKRLTVGSAPLERGYNWKWLLVQVRKLVTRLKSSNLRSLILPFTQVYLSCFFRQNNWNWSLVNRRKVHSLHLYHFSFSIEIVQITHNNPDNPQTFLKDGSTSWLPRVSRHRLLLDPECQSWVKSWRSSQW